MLSGLFLGLGFAFKYYPLFLLPFYMVKLKSWPERFKYFILFILPMALSFIPIYLLSPMSIHSYLFGFQTGEWLNIGNKSFFFAISTLLQSITIFGIRISSINMGIFVILIGILFITYAYVEDPRSRFKLFGSVFYISNRLTGKRIWREDRGKTEDQVVLFWYKITVILYFIYLGAMALTFTIQPLRARDLGRETITAISIIILMGYSICLYIIIKRFGTKIFPGSFKGSKTDRFILYSIFAILLLLLGSPNSTPHYIIWSFPFILLVRNRRIMLVLLAISIWNVPGEFADFLPKHI